MHATRKPSHAPVSQPLSSESSSSSSECLKGKGKMVERDSVECEAATVPGTSTTSASPTDPLPSVNEEEILAGVAGMDASKGVDICFAFDTTGSMSSIIQKVRSEVKTTCERLMRDIPGIRISIMTIGDYCDELTSYVVHSLDFSNNPEQIKAFVSADRGSGGGDFPEAYEWALYKARKLSWRDDPQVAKALVMISDAIPHERWHTTANVHWQEELAALADFGVRVYGVQASNNGGGPAKFNARLAERSGGLHLQFTKFHLITTMFLALCYKEAGKEQLENFREEVKKDKELGEDKEMQIIMDDLVNKEQKVEKVESKIVCKEPWYTGQTQGKMIPTFAYNPKRDTFQQYNGGDYNFGENLLEGALDNQFMDPSWKRHNTISSPPPLKPAIVDPSRRPRSLTMASSSSTSSSTSSSKSSFRWLNPFRNFRRK